MANKGVSGARSPLNLVVAMALCCFFYVLGAWQRSGYGKGDRIAAAVSRQTACGDVAAGLSFETHHGGAGAINASSSLPFGADAAPPAFAPCAAALADHTPCHDQDRAMKFPRKNMVYRERHCPADGERLRCLVPAPPGYVTPFPWPRSRDYVPFANAPYKSLTVEKAVQNWVQYEGAVFRFPGGGTQFPQGADKYIDQLGSVIPFAGGRVRTVLDTGCGVCAPHRRPNHGFGSPWSVISTSVRSACVHAGGELGRVPGLPRRDRHVVRAARLARGAGSVRAGARSAGLHRRPRLRQAPVPAALLRHGALLPVPHPLGR
jgi:hypothetical protein